VSFAHGAERETVRAHHVATLGRENVPFASLSTLLKRLGFEERISGDHHIFTMRPVEVILSLQPKSGKGKPYQVKQVRGVILRSNLSLKD